MADEPTRIPRLIEGASIRNLPIDPFEGFMLSRMDGRMSLQDIADSTGAELSQVVALMEKLLKHGVAEWVEVKREAPKRPAPIEAPRRSSVPEAASRVHTRPPPPGTSLVLYDPAELEEPDVELALDRRREILDRFYRLDELDHYALLGVPRDAPKKEIRDAYFALSKTFHPDTLFGKSLGTYKQKMEAVFGALTEAYETLSRKKRRKEYDAYIGLSDTTRAAEAELEEGRKSAEAIEGATIANAASAVITPPAPAPEAPPEPEAEPEPEPPEVESPRSGVPPPAPDSVPRKSEEERLRLKRELYRRRLSARTDRRISVQGERRKSESGASRHDLLRGLAGSLRSAARLTGGVDRSIAQVRAARKAEADGDLVAATNALRLALSLNDSAEIRAEYERVRLRLAGDLAETYEKQAQYEEANQKWGAAALSWKKVGEGRPNSAEPLWRAARAIVNAGGDLKHARELAQEAVARLPGSARARATLGEVYLAAGMSKSARKELEEASKLDPGDEIVKNLLSRL